MFSTSLMFPKQPHIMCVLFANLDSAEDLFANLDSAKYSPLCV